MNHDLIAFTLAVQLTHAHRSNRSNRPLVPATGHAFEPRGLIPPHRGLDSARVGM